MREQKDTIVSPIYEWSDRDVWDFLKGGHYPYNPMYDMGYHRVGCIGCPMATWKQKKKEFADFPYVKELYIKAFDDMIKERIARGKNDPEKWGFKNGQEVFEWWIEEYKHVTKGQITINEYMETVDDMGFIIKERKV